jgi:hypothetical protein
VEAVNTVKVDVCQPGMPCLATRCTAPARFSVQRDGQLMLLYCGPDTLNRIGMHQRQRREIVMTGEAQRLLAKVGL